MGRTVWCLPLVYMGKCVAVVAVVYARKATEDKILVLVDVASHALPVDVIAWHLGQLHV